MGSLLMCSLDLVHPLPVPQFVQVGVFYRQTNLMSRSSKNRDLCRRLSHVATQSPFPRFSSYLLLKANLFQKLEVQRGT